ncbi:hypothetical protein CIAN88_10435 [[Clostridium] innocuum]|uniref:Uncharacterized protein n=1 Tax=Clostridium innocuum TaxID=1522 RepID=A0A099I613_CLOIN|nr:hypothetical protein CIAN88_10435 [[Clostridium] innocuum]
MTDSKEYTCKAESYFNIQWNQLQESFTKHSSGSDKRIRFFQPVSAAYARYESGICRSVFFSVILFVYKYGMQHRILLWFVIK